MEYNCGGNSQEESGFFTSRGGFLLKRLTNGEVFRLLNGRSALFYLGGFVGSVLALGGLVGSALVHSNSNRLEKENSALVQTVEAEVENIFPRDVEYKLPNQIRGDNGTILTLYSSKDKNGDMTFSYLTAEKPTSSSLKSKSGR